MTTLRFIGTRQRDFVVIAGGKAYYVQPDKPLELPDDEAAELLTRDPQLWERVEEKPRKPAKE